MKLTIMILDNRAKTAEQKQGQVFTGDSTPSSESGPLNG
jgi:hypothetical protein